MLVCLYCCQGIYLLIKWQFHYGLTMTGRNSSCIKEYRFLYSSYCFCFSFLPSYHTMGFDSTIKTTSERAETLLSLVGSPIKPHLPSISRFLIVATFYEDALRIIWQWKDQIVYLEVARQFPQYTAPAFLGFNATVGTLCMVEGLYRV